MSGITNNAAIKGHHPIHNPEVDEERVGLLSPSSLLKLQERLYSGMTDM
jgi:hypothetical protein